MIVNYWLLFIAVVLLCFPRQWLRKGARTSSSSRSRKKKRAVIGDNDVIAQAKEELLKVRNWVDFFRSGAAGLAVVHLCFDQSPEVADDVGLQIFLIQIGIFLVGVLVQTVRLSQGGLSFVAPVFFMLGLSFGLIGWKAALFVCVAGFFLNRVLPGPGVFLFVFAVLELGFGMMLPGSPLGLVLLAVGLSMTPALLSGVTKRQLVWLNKSQTKPM